MVAVLVCDGCGLSVRAPGAYPGREGRCPSCGARMVVPEEVPSPVAREAPVASPEVRTRPQRAARPRREPSETAPGEEGFRLAGRPHRVEAGPGASLLYPLWDEGGLALLIFFPPVWALTSILSIGLRDYIWGDDEVVTMGSLTMAAPMLVGLLMALGYAYLFLEQVFLTTSRGEVRHPRWPPWVLGEMLGGLGRGLAACSYAFAAAALVLAATGSPGGAPAAGADASLLPAAARMAAAGLCAALIPVPLMAVAAHGAMAAANPLTVVAATIRLGRGLCGLSLGFGLVGAALMGVVPLLFGLPGAGLRILGTWLAWVAFGYAALVLVRRLGLLYRRRARALGWFAT